MKFALSDMTIKQFRISFVTRRVSIPTSIAKAQPCVVRDTRKYEASGSYPLCEHPVGVEVGLHETALIESNNVRRSMLRCVLFVDRQRLAYVSSQRKRKINKTKIISENCQQGKCRDGDSRGRVEWRLPKAN